ncbi:hypothetical protein EX30DRAFT_51767 [Ascodesmis nigricans]|uniref:Uncharacterized protein n=1 Tax=Ascodesmis nigricans TaxID=341454 RepID=A0A4S2MVC2_9PEZI|nr:hypothetical protein EX30DRAFT_51767 [Ascodesmis nigricans]
MADLQQVLTLAKTTATPIVDSIATEVKEATAILAAVTGVSIASQILQSAIICDQSNTGASTFENSPVAGCILPKGKSAFQSAFDELQSTIELSGLSGIPETPSLTPDQAVLQKELLEAWNSPIGNHTINDLLQPVLKYITLITKYVSAHPWVLASIFAGPLVVTAFEAALWMIGFTKGGVALGSIAALIQSKIGNVSKDSIFAYLQHYGAVNWGRRALILGGSYLAIALVIIFAGKLLIESGVIPNVVIPFLERVWNSALVKFGANIQSLTSTPPAHSGTGPHETLGSSLLIAVLLGAGIFLVMM